MRLKTEKHSWEESEGGHHVWPDRAGGLVGHQGLNIFRHLSLVSEITATYEYSGLQTVKGYDCYEESVQCYLRKVKK